MQKATIPLASACLLTALSLLGSADAARADTRRLAVGGEMSVLHFPVAPCLTYYVNDDVGIGVCASVGINDLSRSTEVFLARTGVLTQWHTSSSSLTGGLAGTRQLRLGAKFGYARGAVESLIADDARLEGVVGAARLELLIAPAASHVGLLAYVDAGVLWYATENDEALSPHIGLGFAVTLR
ncbi:MAG: hypothetical protein IPL79_00345 [Myxococcales bacterium]|nr:hypothetical protein [Myxococcales bacterium]